MKIRQGISVDYFIIDDLERLDPVTVIIKDAGQSGKIIIECFGEAWSTYFGSIGNRKLNDFISGIDSGYLSSRLISNTFHRPTKRETVYIERIAQTVIDACKMKTTK